MSMRDLHNNIDVKRVISPVSVGSNTAQVGQIIDRQGYNSLEYVIALGSIADDDATFAVTLEESDDAAMANANAVHADHLLGSLALASFDFDDDNELRKLGYKGHKRYTRLTITPTGNSAAALMSVVAVLANPHIAPTDNPPA